METAPTPTSSAQLWPAATSAIAWRLPAVAVLVGGLYLISRYHYLLFHSLVEIYSISIAFAIFMVAWNSRAVATNSYLSVVGVAYLFIGFLDLLHTLSYKGMQIFLDYDYYANQLWIATRYMESLTLLLGFLAVGRKRSPDMRVVFLFYLAVTAVLVASIFVFKTFPVCFVEGVGLTPFKKISEYLICALLLGALGLLVRIRRQFQPDIFRLLGGSLLASIVAELAFTFYLSNYGFSNLVGHYFKLLSFYLIYKAIVQTGIRLPYDLVFRELKAKEAELERQAMEDAMTGLFNRRAAFQLLAKSLGAAERQRHPCTVGYVDLDDLKGINDRHGHAAGDQMICLLAAAIRQQIRVMDYACRLGGDEFLVIFPGCTAEVAHAVLKRVAESLAAEVAARALPYPLTFSWGLAEYSGAGSPDAQRLLEHADQHMYRHKQERKLAKSAAPEQIPCPT